MPSVPSDLHGQDARTTGTPAFLSHPIESLPGIGPSRAKAFRSLGVTTLAELLDYFPRTYQFESSELPIDRLVANQIQTARGEVVAVDYIPSRPRPRFEATLDDGTGRLSLAWFHGAYLRTRIFPGQQIRVRGKVSFFKGIPRITQAKWEIVDESTAKIEDSKFRPIYPATLRLPSDVIARTIDEQLDAACQQIPEWFEVELLKKRSLFRRREAYRSIHRPRDWNEALRARRRIIYDELMLMQLGLGISRKLRDKNLKAPVFKLDKTLNDRICRRFPFTLTAAQQTAAWDIARDLISGRPMNRLLQGDVGSGKTVVALYAMLVAVANGFQAAILAPTEVLAEQHYFTLHNLLQDSKVNVGIFTGRTKRKKNLAQLADGTVHIAIGTQALIQEDVAFENLGLVVVDEQHKLGVRQRAVLKGKGLSPHYLVMTATPIPRTLALSFFADFDVTTINELPPGRQPIHTRWLRSNSAGEAYEFIREQVGSGRQAYIVLPQIDDTGLDDAKSVLKESDRLGKGPLSGLRLGVLHGQLPADEKQHIMSQFRAGEIAVLVSTTVIEVGIDVANATVMLIDNAERFGLSQLHQLRGRVGRGEHPSHCLLLSDAITEIAEARLKAMTESNDGFEIAEMDLKLRGPGEFFGTRQHGLPEFKLAEITSELPLLQQAREDAQALLTDDPRLMRPAHTDLRKALRAQIGDSLDLAQVG
jgi:ATP-dependent DNA helicase RecG